LQQETAAMSNEKPPRQNAIENSQERGPRTDKQLETPRKDSNSNTDSPRDRAREGAKEKWREDNK
jgi:hypothetical protein